MYGAIEFYREAPSAGIKPIIGCELYVAPRTRIDREPEQDRRRYHLTALADERDRLPQPACSWSARPSSRASTTGRASTASCWRATSRASIVLSGCPSAEVAAQSWRRPARRRPRDAGAGTGRSSASDFFVELQSTACPSFGRRQPRAGGRWRRELELPLVATNDVHYARPEDADAHDILLCIQTSTTMNDPKRMRYGDDVLPARRGRDARRSSPSCPRPSTTPPASPRCATSSSSSASYKLPRLRRAGRRVGRRLPARPVRAGPEPALPAPSTPDGARRGSNTSSASSTRWASTTTS